MHVFQPFFLRSHPDRSVLGLCVFVSRVCKCARVLNSVCVCVLILVAATRSYSRSTGALHTPDTFGAAGEGWVHLFLCTSPTHFALIFVRSVFFLFSLVPRIFSWIICQPVSFLVHQPPCFVFLFVFYIVLQDVEPSSGIACFRPFSCQLTTILPVVPICFLYLALRPSLQGHQHVLLCFCQSYFLPQWHLQCHLTSHHINLQDWLMWTEACVGWVNVREWMMRSMVDHQWTSERRLDEWEKGVSNFRSKVFSSDSLQDRVLASVSPVASLLQSVPWGSSTRALTLKRHSQMRWY